MSCLLPPVSDFTSSYLGPFLSPFLHSFSAYIQSSLRATKKSDIKGLAAVTFCFRDLLGWTKLLWKFSCLNYSVLSDSFVSREFFGELAEENHRISLESRCLQDSLIPWRAKTRSDPLIGSSCNPISIMRFGALQVTLFPCPPDSCLIRLQCTVWR